MILLQPVEKEMPFATRILAFVARNPSGPITERRVCEPWGNAPEYSEGNVILDDGELELDVGDWESNGRRSFKRLDCLLDTPKDGFLAVTGVASQERVPKIEGGGEKDIEIVLGDFSAISSR